MTNPARAAAIAKRSYPDFPESKWETVELQWLMIKSRRSGLTETEFARYDNLVKLLLPDILEWGERWIISICDTYAENGVGAALVPTAIRMMEKFAAPAALAKKWERRVSLNGADIHINLARRFSKLVEEESPLPHLFMAVWKSIIADKSSVLGRFSSISKLNLVDGVRRVLK